MQKNNKKVAIKDCHLDQDCLTFSSPSSFYKRPNHLPNQVIRHANEPRLGPVQVRVGRLRAEDAQGVEGVVRGPFTLERVDGTVPDLALGMPFAHRQQLSFEILLAYLKGRFQVDVGGGNGVVNAFIHYPASSGPNGRTPFSNA